MFLTSAVMGEYSHLTGFAGTWYPLEKCDQQSQEDVENRWTVLTEGNWNTGFTIQGNVVLKVKHCLGLQHLFPSGPKQVN